MSIPIPAERDEGQGRVLADVQEHLQSMRRGEAYGKITITVQAGNPTNVEWSLNKRYVKK